MKSTAQWLESVSGISNARLRQLVNDGIIPAFPPNKEFDPTEHVKGLIQYYRVKKSEENADIEAERLRLTREQADKVALENATTRRELIPSEWAGKLLSSVIVEIKTKVMACTSMIDSDKDDLLASIRHISAEEIVNRLDPTVPAPRGATAEADGEPVGGSVSVPQSGEQREAGEVSGGSGTVSGRADGRRARGRRAKRVPNVREPDRQGAGA